MKVLYCWRCQTEMPMLDEAEWREWHAVFDRCMQDAKAHGRDSPIQAPESRIDKIFEPARHFYSELTGAPEVHQNEIWHHRAANLGPPCASCSKPLRTPRAKLCAECGARREAEVPPFSAA